MNYVAYRMALANQGSGGWSNFESADCVDVFGDNEQQFTLCKNAIASCSGLDCEKLLGQYFKDVQNGYTKSFEAWKYEAQNKNEAWMVGIGTGLTILEMIFGKNPPASGSGSGSGTGSTTSDDDKKKISPAGWVGIGLGAVAVTTLIIIATKSGKGK